MDFWIFELITSCLWNNLHERAWHTIVFKKEVYVFLLIVTLKSFPSTPIIYVYHTIRPMNETQALPSKRVTWNRKQIQGIQTVKQIDTWGQFIPWSQVLLPPLLPSLSKVFPFTAITLKHTCLTFQNNSCCLSVFLELSNTGTVNYFLPSKSSICQPSETLLKHLCQDTVQIK